MATQNAATNNTIRNREAELTSRIIMNLRLESRNGSLCCGRPKIGVRAYLPNPSQIVPNQRVGNALVQALELR